MNYEHHGGMTEGDDTWQKMRNALGFTVWSWAFTAEVVLRHTFGERYIDRQALGGLVLMVVFPIFIPNGDPRPLLFMVPVYLLLCAVARTGVLIRRFAGPPVVHSMYAGRPRLMRWMGSLSERTVKRAVEPLLTCSVGLALTMFNLPLGAFIVGAGVALLLIERQDADAEREMQLDTNDMLTEASYRASTQRTGWNH